MATPTLTVEFVDEFGTKKFAKTDLLDSTCMELLVEFFTILLGFGFNPSSVNETLVEEAMNRDVLVDKEDTCSEPCGDSDDALGNDLLIAATKRILKDELEKGGDIDS